MPKKAEVLAGHLCKLPKQCREKAIAHALRSYARESVRKALGKLDCRYPETLCRFGNKEGT